MDHFARLNLVVRMTAITRSYSITVPLSVWQNHFCSIQVTGTSDSMCLHRVCCSIRGRESATNPIRVPASTADINYAQHSHWLAKIQCTNKIFSAQHMQKPCAYTHLQQRHAQIMTAWSVHRRAGPNTWNASNPTNASSLFIQNLPEVSSFHPASWTTTTTSFIPPRSTAHHPSFQRISVTPKLV